MVILFILLSWARAEVKHIVCTPYSQNGGKMFAATGTLDAHNKAAHFYIQIKETLDTQQPFELIGKHNRYFYEIYFLENLNAEVPSMILKIAKNQMSVESEIYLNTQSHRFTAICEEK